MRSRTLTIIPSVPVWVEGEYYIFDRKFYDGILLYVTLWPGSVRCVINVSNQPLPVFGVVKKAIESLPFECRPVNLIAAIGRDDVIDSAVVMASGDSYDQLHISQVCKLAGVRCVYVIEYIPETRYQIVAFETNNVILRLRRWFFIWNTERRRINAFKLCDGIQANGTPAFINYAKYGNAIEYFDTRVEAHQLVASDELEKRFEYLLLGRPLRLAFSGRLILMKGVDHLIVVAKFLKLWGVPFSLSIYGAGDLEAEIKVAISESDLSGSVVLNGPVDFITELLPNMKSSVDLFVCLHRQSDPSCTYMETFSCGVPILGYDNKAFAGIMNFANVGWLVKSGEPERVAEVIQRISANRNEIIEKSQAAIALARGNDFMTIFEKRIAHLLAIVGE
jgi:colanic acid/amylovoran biosynthesis glycosyltransferase